MKFLCVKCDNQMQLKQTLSQKDQGSLSVVFFCPDCAQETAMLTNPGETQLLQSLGIALGGDKSQSGSTGKCPFAIAHAPLLQDGAESQAMSKSSAEGKCPVGEQKGEANSTISWTAEALHRLENVPDMIRPMAKMGVEKFAQQRGLSQIDLSVLDQARQDFGL